MNNSLHHKSLSRMLLPNSARLLMVLVPCIASPLAFAEGQHYQHNVKPVCTITVANTGLSATADCGSAVAAGLGNADLKITVSLGASAPTYCHNPKGKMAPGQNPAIALGSTSLDIPKDLIKNGSLTIPPLSASVTLATPTPQAAGCPNGKWTVTVGPATFGPGSYRVEQPVGTVLQALSFIF